MQGTQIRLLLSTSLVALAVALAAQMLLESVIPVSAFDWLHGSAADSSLHLRIVGQSFWQEDSILRLAAFGIGGFAAGVFARSSSWRLIACLVAVSLAASMFAESPGKAATWQLATWMLSGPVGAIVGWTFARGVAHFHH